MSAFEMHNQYVESTQLNDNIDINMDSLMKIFQNFDKGGTGAMLKDEALLMGESLGLNHEEMGIAFDEIDINGDGDMQLHEFIDYIRNLSGEN